MRAASAVSAAKGKTTSRARFPCPGMDKIEATMFNVEITKMIVLGKLWKMVTYVISEGSANMLRGRITPASIDIYRQFCCALMTQHHENMSELCYGGIRPVLLSADDPSCFH